MKKFIIPALVLAASLFAACTEADKFEYGREVVYVTGTGSNAIASQKINTDVLPVSYPFSISATGKVAQDIKVNLKVDPSAVEKFNAINGTNYVSVPEEAVQLDSNYVMIYEGRAASSLNVATLIDNSYMEDGVSYVIPVSIDSVEGDAMDVLDASRTIMVRLAKSQLNYSLNINSTSLYSTYSFGSAQGIQLNEWTLEVKAYPTNLKTAGTDKLCRLCCWNEDGGGQVLLRFNENGQPWKSLDIVSVNGRYDTGETTPGSNVGKFEENKWQLISIVWDGAAMKVYVNGELDEPSTNEVSGSQSFKFHRFEIGMSWGNYGSAQSYTGRMAEVRVWNVARSRSQIAENLCSVDPASNGLCAYWRMNEGTGTVFKDTATWTEDGSEKKFFYDMDWSQSERDARGNDPSVYSRNTAAGGAVKWVRDAANSCLQ